MNRIHFASQLSWAHFLLRIVWFGNKPGACGKSLHKVKNAGSNGPAISARMSVDHRTHHTPVTCHDDESSSTIEAGPAGPTYAIARQSGHRREARKRPLHRHQRTGENVSRLS